MRVALFFFYISEPSVFSQLKSALRIVGLLKHRWLKKSKKKGQPDWTRITECMGGKKEGYS